MLKTTIIFDNWIASPDTPVEFVMGRYLSERGKLDLRDIKVEQESEFEPLSKDEHIGSQK